MFFIGIVLLCSAAMLFSLVFLLARNPKQTILKRYPSLEVLASIMLVAFFCFGAFYALTNMPTTRDLLFAAIAVIATVAIFRFLRVSHRLAAYATEEKNAQIIVGDFSNTTPSDKPQSPYRKAA